MSSGRIVQRDFWVIQKSPRKLLKALDSKEEVVKYISIINTDSINTEVYIYQSSKNKVVELD